MDKELSSNPFHFCVHVLKVKLLNCQHGIHLLPEIFNPLLHLKLLRKQNFSFRLTDPISLGPCIGGSYRPSICDHLFCLPSISLHHNHSILMYRTSNSNYNKRVTELLHTKRYLLNGILHWRIPSSNPALLHCRGQ